MNTEQKKQVYEKPELTDFDISYTAVFHAQEGGSPFTPIDGEQGYIPGGGK